MRQSAQGILQLGQALRDHSAGRPIPIVDEAGKVVEDDDGQPKIINNTYLRGEFSPAGKGKAPRPGDSPSDRLRTAVHTFGTAVKGLLSAFEAIGRVEDDDGRPLVDRKDVDARDCENWRETIRRIDEELVFWSSTHGKANGVTDRSEPEQAEIEDFGDEAENLQAAE